MWRLQMLFGPTQRPWDRCPFWLARTTVTQVNYMPIYRPWKQHLIDCNCTGLRSPCETCIRGHRIASACSLIFFVISLRKGTVRDQQRDRWITSFSFNFFLSSSQKKSTKFDKIASWPPDNAPKTFNVRLYKIYDIHKKLTKDLWWSDTEPFAELCLHSYSAFLKIVNRWKSIVNSLWISAIADVFRVTFLIPSGIRFCPYLTQVSYLRLLEYI